MATLILPEQFRDQVLSGKMTSYLVRPRKRDPFVAGGPLSIDVTTDGRKRERICDTRIVGMIRIARTAAGRWAYRDLSGDSYLSPLDMKQLAEVCGFTSVVEFDKYFRTRARSTSFEMLKITWKLDGERRV